MSLSHQVKAWKGCSACLVPGCWEQASPVPAGTSAQPCVSSYLSVHSRTHHSRPGSLLKTSTPEGVAVSHSTAAAGEAAPLTRLPRTRDPSPRHGVPGADHLLEVVHTSLSLQVKGTGVGLGGAATAGLAHRSPPGL